MVDDDVTVRREDLYEQVWTSPVRQVATRYGVSDVALAKVCARLAVPVPGRGYWAKKAAGQSLPRAPLPPLPAGASAEHTFFGTQAPRAPPASARPAVAAETAVEPKIVVAETLASPHALVKLSAPLLREAGKHATRVVHLARVRCLDIAVAPASLPRALRVMDALLKALEARGYPVEATPPALDRPDEWGRAATTVTATRARIGGEWVEFGIYEVEKQEPRRPEPPPAPTKKGRAAEAPRVRLAYPRGYFRCPTAELVLTIRSAAHRSERRRWGDGPAQRVEDRLNDFVAEMVRVAEALRVARVERERAERERVEERRREAEAEQRRHVEAAWTADLEGRAEDWAKACRIREFVAAVEARAADRPGALAPDTELAKWVAWARRKADALANDAADTVLRLRTPEAPPPMQWPELRRR